MQLHTHIASKFYLTALIPEGTARCRGDGHFLSWCAVQGEWEFQHLELDFPCCYFPLGGWLGPPRGQSKSRIGGPWETISKLEMKYTIL